ncbi:MAG: SMP-30/gluconolactonase/LRE family protein [Pseudomonadota bacterium]
MTDLLATALTPITDERALLGEGPCYHPRLRRVFWLDIKGQRLFSADENAGDVRAFDLPQMVSALAPARVNDFVCTHRRGFGLLSVTDKGVSLTPINHLEADKPGNRFNDGKMHPDGSFWAGTMDDAETERSGVWWRLDPDGQTTHLLDGIRVTNGPAFSARGNVGYFNDSADQTVFTFDASRGRIENKRCFKVFSDGEGYPDGILIDREDCLWAAFWDGRCIRRLGRDGSVYAEISVPALRPTSLEIVGKRLFVTTAAIGLSSFGNDDHDGRTLTAELAVDLSPTHRPIFDDTEITSTITTA